MYAVDEEQIIIKSNDFERLPDDFGEISITSKQDYDDDGLDDIDEIDFELVNKYSKNNDINNLPSLTTLLYSMDCDILSVGVDRYQDLEFDLSKYSIVPLLSDPILTDTDNDSLIDSNDRHPQIHLDENFMYVKKDFEPEIRFVKEHKLLSDSCYGTKSLKLNPLASISWPIVGMLSIAAQTTDIGTMTLALLNNQNTKFLTGTMPNASYALQHYLGNSGNIWQLTSKDVSSLITTQTSNREHYITNLKQLMLYAQENLEKNSTFFISSSYDAQFRGTCYYKKESTDTTACNMMHNNFDVYENNTALDWGHTIGESFAAMYGEVTFNGTVYKMKYKYYIKDIYEWAAHYDDTELSAFMHSLHEAGFAKEFLISGYIEDTIIWYDGENLSDEIILQQLVKSMYK